MHLVVTDQRAHGRCDHEDLGRHAASTTTGAWQQGLRHDSLEHERQLRAHLRLLVAREDVDDTIDRLGRRVGVQRGEDEVAGLGDGERRLDRLQVAHFADEDDVRVFS